MIQKKGEPMKKLIFISLLAIPLCKAADPYESWNHAIQDIPNWQTQETLNLSSKEITAVPDDLQLPLTILDLNLSNNLIEHFNHEIINRSSVVYVDLRGNPIEQQEVKHLKQELGDINVILFIDDEPSITVKPAKRH